MFEHLLSRFFHCGCDDEQRLLCLLRPVIGDASFLRHEWPKVLRVVRCLPSAADMRERDDATRASVAQASREETAACFDAARKKLSSYGDLTGGSRARWRQPVHTSADDIAPMRDGDDARSDSWMIERARYDVTTTQGKAVRYRR